MFKVIEFSTVRISSENISKSRDWYQSLFGVDPVEDFIDFVSFKVGGISLDIASADAKSPVGGSVGYWLVDDMDLLVSRAIALGGVVYRGPLRVEETRRTIVQIMGPCGTVVGFEARF